MNDTFGHLVGDLLLQEAAARLRTAARPGDPVVRLAGDEFAILAPSLADRNAAASLASGIVSNLASMVVLDGNHIQLSCTVGVALLPTDGRTVQDLLACADLALYAAKRAGRGRFEFFSQALADELTSRMAMESAIARALQNNEFSLVWQPQVNLATGGVEGVEVLIRWYDPERSVWVPPGDFIPIAEASQLILDIDRFVLRTACLEASAIHAAIGHPLRIRVNVSGGNFERLEFPLSVAAILGQTGLPGHLLELEITEGVLIRNRQVSSRIIQELATIGVRVAIDDFGTGYSSLSYFLDLNVNRLKIDRSFLREIDKSGRKQSIVQAIINFARSLNVETVGEGVETPRQLEAIRKAGCTSAQGFLISPPVRAEEFVLWFNKRAGASALASPPLRLVANESGRAGYRRDANGTAGALSCRHDRTSTPGASA